MDEAILTGESVAVGKFTMPLKEGKVNKDGVPPPLGDRKNMAFFGCVVARGRATALVTCTGMSTELGKIAHSIG